MQRRLITAATLATLMISTAALACGDSLYRVGKGITYRTYSAPLPGNLLIYGQLGAADDLAQQLANSGHDVRVVTSPEELAAELANGQYDVVIASFDDRAAVESQQTLAADYLPIAFGKDQVNEAKQSYDQVMNSEKHEIKHFLKAIHRSLKKRA